MDQIMDQIQLNQMSDAELRTLIETPEGICISLIMPVQQEGDKRAENRIRLKNLIGAAQEKLALLDFRRPDIDQLLAPIEGFVKGGRFLGTGSPGSAFYLAQDFSRVYQLPYKPEELIAVGPQFLVKPLLPLYLNEYFYILTLSQQEVRLLRATQFTVERLDLQDIPHSLAEALRYDDPEREIQWHSQTGSKSETGRAAIFHGHGVGTKETHKENLLRYFQLLDQGISKRLAGDDAPLVLAGVDYLLPIYREVTTYSSLIEEEITGSHQDSSDAELQREAWELVRPHFQEKRKAATALYHQQASKALASADLSTVIPVAYQGRIATLFVASDKQIWGTYDLGTDRLVLHSQSQPGDTDLLDLVAVQTLLNDGEIYLSPHQDVPGAGSLAAIFRY